ncbi:hypothetical protein CK203_057728 [Vitis vinifera]|uniref:Uncharacterized protein n=1 Tax=Vitis vinifera TaxID=29760 RepID=A0A438GM99_VITVI|nr:hypothetical protein CK203_057728 [Vitis vinifera]
MTQGSISFREAQVKVDRSFIIHQVHLNGVVELLNSNGIDTFRVNGIASSHSLSHFKPEMRKSTSLSHKKPDQRRVRWTWSSAQHTAILRQIQHHLDITSAPEHAIPSSSEPSQAPPFVDQPMPH